jgi:hypothetical protein
MTRIAHLTRRWATSVSRREPPLEDTEWAESFLLDGELALWRSLTAADRRHAITVGRRFAASAARPEEDWTRDEIAGALLHDIGKLESSLGTSGRVLATIIGPRTGRFRRYHDHERIGADMLVAAGSTAATIDLVRGTGRAAAALAAADHV